MRIHPLLVSTRQTHRAPRLDRQGQIFRLRRTWWFGVILAITVRGPALAQDFEGTSPVFGPPSVDLDTDDEFGDVNTYESYETYVDPVEPFQENLDPATPLVQELEINIEPTEGRLPERFSPPITPTDQQKIISDDKRWQGLAYHWEATALRRRPAYFEDVLLERHGLSRHPLVQPAWSAAKFYATFPLLPYKMFVEPPGSTIYTLGLGRPSLFTHETNSHPYPSRPLLTPAAISGFDPWCGDAPFSDPRLPSDQEATTPMEAMPEPPSAVKPASLPRR